MKNNNQSTPLEPRVAKLEVGLDRLTSDVQNLATIVREQGTQVESEIQKLVVAVTQASGPRKTDWSTIFAGVALILAIGSAVFWPLNQTSQENKQSLLEFTKNFNEHQQLQLHPVGHALVLRLEEQMKLHQESNIREYTAHIRTEEEENAALEKLLRIEFNLANNMIESKLLQLEKKVDLHNERLYARTVRLEELRRLDDEREKDELQMWRQKAMGLPVTPISPNIHSHLDALGPAAAIK